MCLLPTCWNADIVDGLRRLMAVEPIDIDFSRCSSKRMGDVLCRLNRKHYFTDMPCCVAGPMPAPCAPMAYMWEGAEDSRTEVAKGLAWLSRHVTPPGVVCVAVQSVNWLKTHYFKECITLKGETDFVFASEATTARLPQTPTADDLQQLLLPKVLGLYETKTTAHLQGKPCLLRRRHQTVRGSWFSVHAALRHEMPVLIGKQDCCLPEPKFCMGVRLVA